MILSKKYIKSLKNHYIKKCPICKLSLKKIVPNLERINLNCIKDHFFIIYDYDDLYYKLSITKNNKNYTIRSSIKYNYTELYLNIFYTVYEHPTFINVFDEKNQITISSMEKVIDKLLLLSTFS